MRAEALRRTREYRRRCYQRGQNTLQGSDEACTLPSTRSGRRTCARPGMVPYVNRLDMLGMFQMWVGIRPRLTEWFERMKSRASFRPSLLDVSRQISPT